MTALESTYRTELLKVSGLVSETTALLQSWAPGMSAEKLYREAVRTDLLGKASASRVKDLVYKGFAQRLLRPNDRPARDLRLLLTRGATLSTIKQLLFLYTARSQQILADFAALVYWPRAAMGRSELPTDEARRFVVGAFGTERLPGSWSPSIVRKMSTNLPKTLADFGLLGPLREASRPILHFEIEPFVLMYVVHEAHFEGTPDNDIIRLPDWRLFGLTMPDVVERLRRTASGSDRVIFQYSAELARFAWKHQSMEEFLIGYAE